MSQDLSFTLRGLPISPAGSELECGGVDSICMARDGGRPFLLTSAQSGQVKFRSRRRPAYTFLNHCVLAPSASQPLAAGLTVGSFSMKSLLLSHV